MTIVVASHTYLGAPWVVGSHQLARAWARAGHRVLLVSAPITPWHAVRLGDPLIRERFHRAVEGTRAHEPRLSHCVPVGLFPWVWGAHLHARLERALPSFAVGLADTIRRAGFAHPDVLVIDHPQFFNLDRTIAARRFVYRSADLYAEIHERPVVDRLERRLLARVDRAIATSEPVAQRLREHGATNVTLIANGVEFDHFARPTAPPPEYARLGARRAVYSGAIDFRFDGKLVTRLARYAPDVEFVMIGVGRALRAREAARLANLHLLGTRPYAELPRYLQHASVALLPLNAHPANAGRSPMKFYEYAAAGLPVLATRTPELERRAEPFVRFFDPEAPEAALDDMLRRPPRPHPSVAAEHDWARISQRVLALACV